MVSVVFLSFPWFSLVFHRFIVFHSSRWWSKVLNDSWVFMVFHCPWWSSMVLDGGTVTQVHTKTVVCNRNVKYTCLWTLTCKIGIRSRFDPITSGSRAFKGQIRKRVIWKRMITNPVVLWLAEFDFGISLTPPIQSQGYFKIFKLF